MAKLACFLVVTVACFCSADKSLLDGTELLLTFLVHRHGDRTPIDQTLVFSNDPEKLAELSEPYGFGQLTKEGKRRSYQLGRFIRDRYNEFLAPQYNRSEIYIRSTDSTRAKMTILAALAAIYPPGEDSWSEEINWTPVPYTTVPVKYDSNLAIVNCPTFMEFSSEIYSASAPSMEKYSKVLDLLSRKYGMDISKQAAVLVYAIYDLFTSQVSLGLPLDPEIAKAFPEIRVAAGEAIDVIFGNQDYIALQAGVLLQEFYEVVAKIKSGDSTQRVRILSAHDYNVFSFLSVAQISNKQGVPYYASAFALELRKVKKTGQYVVVPVYLPAPGEEVKYLQVEGCDVVCDYDQFYNITSKFARDVDTWRDECGFTNDLVVDDSSIM